jgi:hypothetical protein
MKLGLTEKQYIDLLTLISETDLKEQGDPPASEPEKGTSDKQSGGQGYPSVGKWESGVTRGPANQVGVTKWADVVGAKLTRSKGNQLKEQEGRGSSVALDPEGDKRREDEKKKEEEITKKLKRDDFYVLDIPPTNFSGEKYVILPKVVNGIKTTASFWHHPIKNNFWSNLSNTKYSDLVPTSDMLEKALPQMTLRSFSVGGVQYGASMERMQDKPLIISFKWFYDKDGRPYTEPKYLPKELQEETLWEKFIYSNGGISTELLWIGAAIIVGIFTEGIGTAVMGEVAMSAEAFTFLGRRVTTSMIARFFAEAGVWTIKGGLRISNGQQVAGLIDISFGIFLPVIHELGLINRMGIGKVTRESVDELATKVVGKSEAELVDLFTRTEIEGGLSQSAKDLFVKVSNCSRKVWETTSREAIRVAANKLKSAGVDIQTNLGSLLMKIGDGIHKKWLLRFGFMLIHDLIWIEIFKSLFKKFGASDKESKEIINLAYLNYQKALLEGNEEKLLTDLQNELNSTETKEKIISNIKSNIFEVKDIVGKPPLSDEEILRMQRSMMNNK